MSEMTWGLLTCDKGTGTWALLKKVHITITFIRLLVVCTAQRQESIPRLEYFWLPFNRWEGCSDQHSSPWKCEYQSCRPHFLSIRASQNTVGISDKTEEEISVVRWKLTNHWFQLQQAQTDWMNVLGMVPGVRRVWETQYNAKWAHLLGMHEPCSWPECRDGAGEHAQLSSLQHESSDVAHA